MHKSPLGLLYYPNYLVEGIAIHGNPAVPAFPASHGCIRIPMYAAVEFTNIAAIGTQVVIHNGAEKAAVK
jgi:lipoprotein-anchoring transpeptidase ErfK/SrfK